MDPETGAVGLPIGAAPLLTCSIKAKKTEQCSADLDLPGWQSWGTRWYRAQPEPQLSCLIYGMRQISGGGRSLVSCDWIVSQKLTSGALVCFCMASVAAWETPACTGGDRKMPFFICSSSRIPATYEITANAAKLIIRAERRGWQMLTVR